MGGHKESSDKFTVSEDGFFPLLFLDRGVVSISEGMSFI
jgi:hypothetical protein